MHRDLLSRLQIDRRLPDSRGRRLNRDDVRELYVLERDEDRHELRDARDRDVCMGVPRGEYLARSSVDDEERARVGRRRSGGSCRRGERERSEDREEQPLHGRPPYQPETDQISSRKRAASAPAAVRQSPPRARYA